MAWAAVLRTYGDMSDAASLMANIMMGTMMVTLMLDSTRRALARISWLGSWIRGYNESQIVIYVKTDASVMWLHTAESKGVRGISFIWTLEGVFGPIWHFGTILSVYWAFSCITISIFSILCTMCCKFIFESASPVKVHWEHAYHLQILPIHYLLHNCIQQA